MNLAPEHSLLTRVLEVEVMDSAEDARDYDAMDHSEVNRRFVADFLVAGDRVGLATDALVLDLGTGTAQIPLELCAQNPRAKVLAIDLADHMIRLAHENVTRAGLDKQIELQLVDAKRLPYSDGHFPAVMSNSIVHHIPEPQAAIAEALRVLESGGLIFVRDLSRPRDKQQVKDLVASYATGCNSHQRQLFKDSLHAALSVAEVRAMAERLGFDPSGVQPTSDRHWTWIAIKQ